jgi:hypothetical protein
MAQPRVGIWAAEADDMDDDLQDMSLGNYGQGGYDDSPSCSHPF